jgi:hypothetical protein
MVASNATSGSDPRPGSESGTNKQEHLSNNKDIQKREWQVLKDHEGQASGKERSLRGTIPVLWSGLPALFIYLDEVVPAAIKIRISLINHTSRRVPSRRFAGPVLNVRCPR